MNFDLHIDPEHFAYLRIQKGNLDQYADDFHDWKVRYQADLQRAYESIVPWLPASCSSFLDIGSGLGGMDVLIRRHYEIRLAQPIVALLDGWDDPPKMKLHRRTFNSMRQARNFQVKNGCFPLRFEAYGPDVTKFDRAFDLVVSFGSWCFHYPPSEYLPQLVKTGMHAGTVFILEVRTNKPDWMAALERHLELVTLVTLKPKWSRAVFRVKSK
jgi:SAM-dependent methyltransferase